jgi:hypothetical protein
MKIRHWRRWQHCFTHLRRALGLRASRVRSAHGLLSGRGSARAEVSGVERNGAGDRVEPDRIHGWRVRSESADQTD